MFIGFCTIFFFSASTLNGWGLSYDVIVIQYCICVIYMGLNARKPAFGGVHTTKAQTSLSDQRLCYSLIGKYHIYTYYEQNFIFLASLCS